MAAGSGCGNGGAAFPRVGNWVIAENKRRRSVLKRKMISVAEVLKKAKRSSIISDEMDDVEAGGVQRSGGEMTLAEMQSEAKRITKLGKMKKDSGPKTCLNTFAGEKRKRSLSSMLDDFNDGNHREEYTESNRVVEMVLELGNAESNDEHTGIIAVADSDFYDFDEDRAEKEFKKGQIWAIYDDDDGMPRHYGLIDEVVSVSPFKLNLIWLDLQNNRDQASIFLEKFRFNIPCGMFKVSRKTPVNLVNVFSHLVDCERVAKHVYWIYPNKGSVWAVYRDVDLESCSEEQIANYKRAYDVVLFLTSYTEVHGGSMAYLEKVECFRTVFKRREVGCDAVRYLERDRTRLLSHQIPSRKLSDSEIPSGMKDCWELDPAALPPDFLIIQKGS